MRKSLLLFAALLLTLQISAEGFQVNNLSSRQNGMGHVGTAMKLGAESLHFNPAAAAFQTSRFDISFGITGIAPSATYTPANDYSGTPLRKYHSDSGISTPLYLYFNYKPSDRWAVGVSFTTPFGSSMKWDDNWAGAHLIQNIDLKAYQVQPTVSFKICPTLSIGAGLTVAWGNFNLARSMFPVGEMTNNYIGSMLTAAGMGQYAPLFTAVGDNPLLSARLDGSADVAVGVNAGIMWDPHEQWTLAFAYRSRMTMKVGRGHAALAYHSPEIEQILGATGMVPRLDQATFNTRLPLPSNLTWAVSFRPAEKWELAVDLQWIGWSAYKELNVSFNEAELGIDDIYSVKNYQNTLAFRFGGEYRACDWLHARMGMYVDESPVRSDYLNPETPSATKLAFTAGLTFNLCRVLSLDVAYAYVATADPERTGSYPYEFGGVQMPFAGNYDIHANTFSIGVRVRF